MQQMLQSNPFASASAKAMTQTGVALLMSALTIERLAIPDVALLTPKRFGDHRGYFVETYNAQKFNEIGLDCTFVQDNQSLSVQRGTVRGLHFQTPPDMQSKLVRVLRGAVFDVAVDLRKGSPTYGRWCGARLTADGSEQLFIPRGFAHGFCTIEPDTEVAYKVDGFYSPHCEGGLRFDDPDLAIEWPIEVQAIILSDKDAMLPRFCEFSSPFTH